MSIHPEKPPGVKLVAALMAPTEEQIESALAALSPEYGTVDLSSPTFLFAHSDYYEEEMGQRLIKRFCSFSGLVDPEEIVDLKLKAIEHERRTLVEGTLRRTVNVDPGYLDRMKLVLTTTKDAYHRVYLSRGIYADVELVYRSGDFAFLEWTFRDYRETSTRSFFLQVREKYLAELRSGT